jgi:ribose transport system substrate-binding protein
MRLTNQWRKYMRTRSLRAALGIAALASALLLTACGGSSSPATASSPSASGSGSGSTTGADVAAAKSAIAPYVGQASKFPIDTPLDKKPTGKRIAYLDCGTPICGLFSQLAQPAFQQLGMKLTTIKAGLKPDTVQAAFDTVIQDKYDGVFVPAIPPQLWARGLAALKSAEIPIVTTGVVDADPYVKVQQAGTINSTTSGGLMADWVVAKHGADANVVLYYSPELAFQGVIKDAFLAEMTKVCSACKVRSVAISVTTFGTTAASTIVSDLQANPNTKTAVFGIGEQTPGLPAALKTANIKIESVVNSPDPANLEEIKKGEFTVGLGLDLPVISWTAADTLARQVTGAEPAPGATADVPPEQFLGPSDLQFDVSKGWTAYPDFAKRFGALWSSAQ